MITSPPRPPSPPEGPPLGTNFSRRNARQPLPPSPAFTRIVTSSINKTRYSKHTKGQGPSPATPPASSPWPRKLFRCVDADELAHPSTIPELNNAGDLGE